jgi:predicted Holliday junction resolvase-like endonuclease
MNLIMMPPIFHIRKHLIENLFCDPVNLLLIVLPLYVECFGLQVAKKMLQAEAVETEMEWRIAEKKKSISAELKKEEEKKKKSENGRDKKQRKTREKKKTISISGRRCK